MPQSVKSGHSGGVNQTPSVGILIETEQGRTMVLAVPSYAQPSRFDSGEAKSDGLAQRRSVDVRDPILVAYTPVREVEALPGDVPVGVRGVIGRQPVGATKTQGGDGPEKMCWTSDAPQRSDRARQGARGRGGEQTAPSVRGTGDAERGARNTHHACTKICFARSDALVVVAARTLAASFSKA